MAAVVLSFPAFAHAEEPSPIRLVRPADGSSSREAKVTIRVACAEPLEVTNSDVFAPGTKLSKGETDVAVSLTREGYNTFTTFVRKQDGPTSLFTFHLFLDTTAPKMEFLNPRSGAYLREEKVAVLVSLSEDVEVLTSSTGFLPSGRRKGGETGIDLTLAPGENAFEATLRDDAGNVRTYAGPSAFRLIRDTTSPPVPIIRAPKDGASISGGVVTVRGTASAGAVGVEIVGNERYVVPVLGGAFTAHVLLVPGANTIRVRALTGGLVTSPEATVNVRASGDAARVAKTRGAASDSTLSFLRQRAGTCEWVRADPAARWEEVVARYEGLCKAANVFWSPDGSKGSLAAGTVLTDATTGLIWWSAYRDPARSVMEVEFASGSATTLPISEIGSIHVLSYNRFSQLIAWTLDGDDTKGWHGRKFRRDTGWKNFVETSAPTRDALEIPQDSDPPELGNCHNDTFTPRVRITSPPVLAHLTEYLGRKPEGNEEWVQFHPGSSYVYLYDYVTPPSVRGRAGVLLIGGRIKALQELGDREYFPRVRGQYLLAVTHPPESAFLYDLSKGSLIWKSDEALRAAFWPRFHGCIDGPYGSIEAP